MNCTSYGNCYDANTIQKHDQRVPPVSPGGAPGTAVPSGGGRWQICVDTSQLLTPSSPAFPPWGRLPARQRVKNTVCIGDRSLFTSGERSLFYIWSQMTIYLWVCGRQIKCLWFWGVLEPDFFYKKAFMNYEICAGKCWMAGWQYMHVSVKEGSPVYNERI